MPLKMHSHHNVFAINREDRQQNLQKLEVKPTYSALPAQYSAVNHMISLTEANRLQRAIGNQAIRLFGLKNGQQNLPLSKIQRNCTCGNQCTTCQEQQSVNIQKSLHNKRIQPKEVNLSKDYRQHRIKAKEGYNNSTRANGSHQTSSNMPTKIKFWINAFIPNTYSDAFQVQRGKYKGRQVFKSPPIHPAHLNSCFETDERGFTSAFPVSSRLHIEGEFDTQSKTFTSSTVGGFTFEIDCATGRVLCEKRSTPRSFISFIPPVIPGSQLFDILISSTNNDPCVFGSPDIAIRGRIGIDLKTGLFRYLITTTLFPAIEMYMSMGNSPITLFRMTPPANSVLLLLPPGLLPHSGSVRFHKGLANNNTKYQGGGGRFGGGGASGTW